MNFSNGVSEFFESDEIAGLRGELPLEQLEAPYDFAEGDAERARSDRDAVDREGLARGYRLQLKGAQALGEEKEESDRNAPEHEQAQHWPVAVEALLEGTARPNRHVGQETDDEHREESDRGRFIVAVEGVSVGVGHEVT